MELFYRYARGGDETDEGKEFLLEQRETSRGACVCARARVRGYGREGN